MSPVHTRRSGARAALAALLLSAAVIVSVPTDSFAQDRTWPPQYRRDRAQFALEASGALNTSHGAGATSSFDATGFDVMASIGVSVLSLGGGYQRSTHQITSGNSVVQGVFFEPRVALPFAARNFTPFAYGRVSRLERSQSGVAGSNPTGTGVGAGVGTYVWIAPNVQLNTTVGWSSLPFANTSASDALPGASPLEFTRGNSWGVRAGLTLGFDRWGR